MSVAAKSVLYIRPDSIGDLVVFSSALAELQAAWPEARHTLLVRSGYEVDLAPLFSQTLHWLVTPVNPFSQRPGEVQAALAVKVPPNLGMEPRAIAEVFESLRVAIAVCANDLPKDLEVDLATGVAKGPRRALSQVHAFYQVSEGLLDVVAVGGINGGRNVYIAHLTGAKAVQVGSALIKEGAGALGRIDRELDALLSEHGKGAVAEIVGQLRFAD